MEADQALIAGATRAFIGSYRTLVRHVDGAAARDFGRVFAFTTGVPIPLFNCVIVNDPPAVLDVETALDWLGDTQLPHLLCVPEALRVSLAPIVERRGLREAAWLVPHMVLPLPVSLGAVPAPAPGVAIRTVPDEAPTGAFRDAMAANGTPSLLAERLIPDSLLEDDEVRGFVAELDGRPVGTSLAIRTGEVTGVYAVGTAEAARRRGVGTAATWAAVETGRSWSSRAVVLQSSEMGFRLYEAMGFRTVARFAAFAPRNPSPGTY